MEDVDQLAVAAIRVQIPNDQLLVHIDALHQIERLLCGEIVFQKRIIKRGHLRNIDADCVCVHAANELEPARVILSLYAEFTRPEPRLCRADVHAFDKERLKRAALGSHQKVLTLHAGNRPAIGGGWRRGGVGGCGWREGGGLRGSGRFTRRRFVLRRTGEGAEQPAEQSRSKYEVHHTTGGVLSLWHGNTSRSPGRASGGENVGGIYN